ncbi:MAG: hypothetical protein OEW67_10545 [Cyclobacteriaceae bacterium]|nr:hypothetical protein [Cyclobacteriaceae bacterium]
MKNSKLYLTIILVSLVVFSCKVDEPIKDQSVVFPETFRVDIPPSISSLEAGSLSGRVEGDGDGIIEGNEIYQSLRYFIAVGEKSAEILEFVLVVGRTLEQLNLSTYSFTSDDDGREKRIDINHDVNKGGVNYQYEMLMYDVLDNNLGLQLLWNTNPVSGIAILKPYNIDRIKNIDATTAIIQIEYSEESVDYDATMVVSIAGLLPVNNGDIDNMKMFAGKKGNIVDVRGNSNHPNVIIIDPTFTGGRNYAFVGRGDDVNNIGVVNLALPPSSVTTNDIFVDYNLYNVLQGEINTVANLDQLIIDAILIEAHSPAYFNNTVGFITSGVGNAPTGFSNEFIDLSGLSTYVPNDIKNLSIDFLN